MNFLPKKIKELEKPVSFEHVMNGIFEKKKVKESYENLLVHLSKVLEHDKCLDKLSKITKTQESVSVIISESTSVVQDMGKFAHVSAIRKALSGISKKQFAEEDKLSDLKIELDNFSKLHTEFTKILRNSSSDRNESNDIESKAVNQIRSCFGSDFTYHRNCEFMLKGKKTEVDLVIMDGNKIIAIVEVKTTLSMAGLTQLISRKGLEQKGIFEISEDTISYEISSEPIMILAYQNTPTSSIGCLVMDSRIRVCSNKPITKRDQKYFPSLENGRTYSCDEIHEAIHNSLNNSGVRFFKIS